LFPANEGSITYIKANERYSIDMIYRDPVEEADSEMFQRRKHESKQNQNINVV